MGRINFEQQYEMTDELAVAIMQYIKNKKITFSEFCNRIGIEKYVVKKIIDRNIKMNVYYSTLLKFANFIGFNKKIEIAQIKPVGKAFNEQQKYLK